MATYHVTGIIEVLCMREVPNTDIVDYAWETIHVAEDVEASSFDEAREVSEAQALPWDSGRFLWTRGPYMEITEV
jgi:hypothetical protein